jgi:hypothetical protein
MYDEVHNCILLQLLGRSNSVGAPKQGEQCRGVLSAVLQLQTAFR